jgi:hypothetical protein
MRERRSYEGIRDSRDCFVRVQIAISVIGSSECPPQQRRALGTYLTEVGHRLERTQGGVPLGKILFTEYFDLWLSQFFNLRRRKSPNL